MGYATPWAAARRGAEVTLVSGPVDLKAPMGVKLVPVVSAKDMFDAVTSVSLEQDAIIKAAGGGQITVRLWLGLRRPRRAMVT